MKYLKYLKYVLKHKWHVFRACQKQGITWLGITHDWSKFRWSEFHPYANHFYGKGKKGISEGRDKTGYYKPTDTGDKDFDYAFFLHQKRNRHHWQHWHVPVGCSGWKALMIPPKYRREMICDWLGASKAQGHGGDMTSIRLWYLANGDKMTLNPVTKTVLEIELTVL